MGFFGWYLCCLSDGPRMGAYVINLLDSINPIPCVCGILTYIWSFKTISGASNGFQNGKLYTTPKLEEDGR